MELHQLEYFRALCQYKSFTKAAAALYISPATLTSSIKKLEAELGVILIVRGNKTFSLTDAGEVLLTCAKNVQNSVDEFHIKLSPVLSEHQIRIAIALPLCSARLLENIDLFSLETPGKTVSVLRRSGRLTRKLLLEDAIDFGFLANARSEDPGLDYMLFERIEYGVFVPADHPWAALDSIPPQLFQNETHPVLNYRGGIKYNLERYFDRFGVVLKESPFVSRYNESTLHFIKQGMGIGIMPVDNYDTGQATVCRPLNPPLMGNHYVAWNKNSPPSSRQWELVDYLMQHNINKL